MTQIAKELINVQYKTIRVITKTFKVTTRMTLNIKTHVLLINLQLNKLIIDVVLRIVTSSSYNNIIEIKTINSLKKLTNKLTKYIKMSIDDFECITFYLISS